MDTFTVMLGCSMFLFALLGEFKQVGAYLWIAALLSLLFAFRMGEFGYYIITVGIVVTFVIRSEYNDDIRSSDEDE